MEKTIFMRLDNLVVTYPDSLIVLRLKNCIVNYRAGKHDGYLAEQDEGGGISGLTRRGKRDLRSFRILRSVEW